MKQPERVHQDLILRKGYLPAVVVLVVLALLVALAPSKGDGDRVLGLEVERNSPDTASGFDGSTGTTPIDTSPGGVTPGGTTTATSPRSSTPRANGATNDGGSGSAARERCR